MSHSINYYIQLTNEMSTTIDAMSKDELLSLATGVNEEYRYKKNKGNETYSELFDIAVSDMHKLVCGLLSKSSL